MAADRALTETEVADLLGLSVVTLRAWRHRRVGPPFMRFGRAVRYLTCDLEAFIRLSRVDNRPVFSPDGENHREEQVAL
jgi:hypothetical protein